ncbi:uncharacterized protein LY79DRAFT_560500 [Colletotrichum navitas]|uniref:Uncharacterized protein n=1 Tax=Colletotrichum navitas TaxID=681940 RepID=A0AAD8V2C7_9PEZI|nr:uncharacterized protein LY79DRAFT_560500 [Colletotrichum navitas]KAK1584767.1 hypothetical protein LY79DRAFT_560500 [Colletotrichum navitas]
MCWLLTFRRGFLPDDGCHRTCHVRETFLSLPRCLSVHVLRTYVRTYCVVYPVAPCSPLRIPFAARCSIRGAARLGETQDEGRDPCSYPSAGLLLLMESSLSLALSIYCSLSVPCVHIVITAPFLACLVLSHPDSLGQVGNSTTPDSRERDQSRTHEDDDDARGTYYTIPGFNPSILY